MNTLTTQLIVALLASATPPLAQPAAATTIEVNTVERQTIRGELIHFSLSEGLMLLTDDGHLSHRLTDPRYGHVKVYWAQVERVPSEEALGRLSQGVWIKGRQTRPAEVELLVGDARPQVAPRTPPIEPGAHVETAWLRLILREGRKRQVRHMTAAIGHPTLRLLRVQIGPIELGELAPGEWRALTQEEIAALKQAVVGSSDARSAR